MKSILYYYNNDNDNENTFSNTFINKFIFIIG